ncbi:MAG: bifunctional folylpolyglutamate synthase/dihydrofolate synthase [Rhizobiales bacterium PAR1]|nr:MAG: bifunctional folylpolyglutamate synthase/dihydrofolate synthase [Rhizobiales bacterium PAR1]
MHDSDGYLARFAQLHPRLIDLSLGRMERLLAALGHPERKLPPVIHVAGTNGKGSTIAFMRAMLEAAGALVHTYTSPHLVRFHERIRLAAPGGGKLVTEDALVEAFERIETVNAGEPITFFEITTVVAFDLFARHPADYVLLEVGLGGRLDTTNVIEHPIASVITPVSMDHREFLGDTLEKIAFEKAGILKRGTPAILAEMDQAALDVCLHEAGKRDVTALVGGQDFQAFEERGRMVFQSEDTFLDLPLPRLAGRHQILNAATAIATLLKVAPERMNQKAIEAGLLSAEWPARFQRLTGKLTKLAPEGAELWLDGGHNADGARVLAEALSALEERSPRPLVLIAGTMARKNAEEILRPFIGLAQEFLAVPVPGEGTRPPDELAAVARKLGMPAAQAGSVEDSLRYLGARTWSEQPRIVITGSLYLAGDVLQADGSLPK